MLESKDSLGHLASCHTTLHWRVKVMKENNCVKLEEAEDQTVNGECLFAKKTKVKKENRKDCVVLNDERYAICASVVTQ